MERFIVLVGGGGSGKSEIAKTLEEKYKLQEVKSFTTRKPRFKDEQTHTFVTVNDFLSDVKNGNVIARTKVLENYYWTNLYQIESKDVVAFDTRGLKNFKAKYRGDKKIVSFYIKTSWYKRLYYMLKRGDGLKKSIKRIFYDRKRFENAEDLCDITIHNKGNKTIEDLAESIKCISKLVAAIKMHNSK